MASSTIKTKDIDNNINNNNNNNNNNNSNNSNNSNNRVIIVIIVIIVIYLKSNIHKTSIGYTCIVKKCYTPK